MISHTTSTLSGKLARAMDIKIRQVVLAPPEQVFGRLKDRELEDKMPAMALDRKGIAVNRENMIRSTAARKGFKVAADNEAEVKILHCLPIKLFYDVGVLSNDRDALDRAEANLLWFVEESGGDIDVKIEMAGVQFELPIQISPNFLGETLDIERSEEWEAAKFYKMTFSLECSSFLLRSSLKPAILTVNYQLREENGLVLVEESYGI